MRFADERRADARAFGLIAGLAGACWRGERGGSKARGGGTADLAGVRVARGAAARRGFMIVAEMVTIGTRSKSENGCPGRRLTIEATKSALAPWP